MACKVQYLADKDVVLLKNSGNVRFSDYMTAMQEVGRLFNRNGTKQILMDDSSLKNMLNTMGIYEFSSLFEKSGIGHDMKMAVVRNPNSANGQNFVFFETVQRNRGYAVRVFDDCDSAFSWLKSSDSH